LTLPAHLRAVTTLSQTLDPVTALPLLFDLLCVNFGLFLNRYSAINEINKIQGMKDCIFVYFITKLSRMGSGVSYIGFHGGRTPISTSAFI
jgi:hypothetical protein